MPMRQWILVAFAGLLGFAAAALCVIYTMSLPVHGVAATSQIGGPFTLVDDTGAMATEKTIAGKPYVSISGTPSARMSVRRRYSTCRAGLKSSGPTPTGSTMCL